VTAGAFSFEDIEFVETRILNLAPKIGYLVLEDRTDRSAEERMGRFDFDEAHAEPYLEDAAAHPVGVLPGARSAPAEEEDDEEESTDEERDDEDGDDEDQDGGAGDQEPAETWPRSFPDDPHGSPRPNLAPLTPVDIARAACRWVRDCAIRNTVGETFRRFRVRIHGPKGAPKIDAGTFICRNHSWTEQPPASSEVMPDLRIPTPTFDQSAKDSTLKGIKALGDYYAQWGQIVLGSVGQLQGVNNSMLARLHRQLQESRGQVDELVASILEYRHNEVETAERRRLEEHAGDTRSELARDALQQLGTAASAYLTGRAVPPDLLETFGAISSSSELTAVLRDPAVRDLMNEPDNLRGLAAMLQAAGQQAQAARQGAQQQATGPPDADSAESPTPETAQPEPNAAD
jgi:hypothetical protein